MRLVTPASLRELSGMIRAKYPDESHAFHKLTAIFDQCAIELEIRDAELEGLRLALNAGVKPELIEAAQALLTACARLPWTKEADQAFDRLNAAVKEVRRG